MLKTCNKLSRASQLGLKSKIADQLKPLVSVFINGDYNIRHVNTVSDRVLENSRHSELGLAIKAPSVTMKPKKIKQNLPKEKYIESNRDHKFIYPDFLPDPQYYFRDKIKEQLEREDMINRRRQINIPEFYVGSIMAVSASDPYAPGKLNRFVGICIRREGYGLRHKFTLRNTVQNLGVEIMYQMYNPTIQMIEVLKLEKRLDDDLSYLQDAPEEYSTIPFDMIPIKLPPGVAVPINKIKVPLNPKPWRHRWDRKALNGIDIPTMMRYEHEKYRQSGVDFKPYARWDMMKHYRETTHDDDFDVIMADIEKNHTINENNDVVIASKKLVSKRVIPQQETQKQRFARN